MGVRQGQGTYVRPVERLMPARKALISRASMPQWNRLPNMVFYLSCSVWW